MRPKSACASSSRSRSDGIVDPPGEGAAGALTSRWATAGLPKLVTAGAGDAAAAPPDGLVWTNGPPEITWPAAGAWAAPNNR